MPELVQLRGVPAGGFSTWLDRAEAGLLSGNTSAEVPCGACRGCCRSKMFIHIRPGEVETIARIPKALLFRAPGLPKGHLVMGYDAKGQCPMLRGNECSIYEHRPQTCRDYDCRVFAATGIAVDEVRQPEIAERVGRWRFRLRGKEDRARQTALRTAAAFLLGHGNLFPKGSLPSQGGAQAVIALRVYRLFLGAPRQPRAMVRAIMAALRERSAKHNA